MPIGIPVFFLKRRERRCRRWSAAAAHGWLAARGGAHGCRLVGCRRRLAAWLSAAARGLAIGRGSGQTATTPYAESRAHRRKPQPLARKAASRAHRRQRKASREPPPPTIADCDVRAVFRTGH